MGESLFLALGGIFGTVLFVKIIIYLAIDLKSSIAKKETMLDEDSSEEPMRLEKLPENAIHVYDGITGEEYYII